MIKPPYTIDFYDLVRSVDHQAHHNLPADCQYPMCNFLAEFFSLDHAAVLRQYHKAGFFFVETYEISNTKKLCARFKLEKDRLFLFIQRKGSTAFTEGNETPIVTIKERHLCAAYNRKGDYYANFKRSEEKHVFIVVAFKRNWLKNNFSKYPHLDELFQCYLTGELMHNHTLSCKLNEGMLDFIRALYAENSNNPGEFNGKLKICISKILEGLNDLLEEKKKFPHIRAKLYIDIHFQKTHISVPFLTETFHTAESSLNEAFNKEFGDPPITYLRKLRLYRTRHLIIINKRPPIEVYTEVGFKDLGNFRRQFRKLFGYTPDEALKMDSY